MTLLFFGRPPHARDVVGVFHLDERGENPNEAARIPRYDGLFIPLAGALQSSRGRDWATVYGVIMPPTRNAPARVEAYELVGRNVRKRLGKFGDVEVSWTGWVPMAFDPTRSRLLVLYDTAGGYLHEFELLTRTWTHHSKPPASLIRPFYFRGQLYANLKDASRAWLVTTTGGDNWKEVGDYTVVAKGSSERFLIVERNADKTYWLLRFE